MGKYRIEDLRPETLEAVVSERLTHYRRRAIAREGQEEPEPVIDAEISTFRRLATESELKEYIDLLMKVQGRHPGDIRVFREICTEMFFAGWRARGALEEADQLKGME